MFIVTLFTFETVKKKCDLINTVMPVQKNLHAVFPFFLAATLLQSTNGLSPSGLRVYIIGYSHVLAKVIFGVLIELIHSLQSSILVSLIIGNS
jgi:uncharacterized MAPEG superfamily protein